MINIIMKCNSIIIFIIERMYMMTMYCERYFQTLERCIYSSIVVIGRGLLELIDLLFSNLFQ